MKKSAWVAAYYEPGAEQAYRPRRQVRRGSGLLGLIRALAEVVIFALFVVTFIVQPYSIPTGSMEPTLMVGDFVLVDKQSYGPSGPLDKVLPPEDVNRNDLVIFHFPPDPNRTLVKRVIGLPGDRLHLRDGVVYINDAPLKEPFAVHSRAVHDTFRDDFPSLRTADPNADPRWWVELRSLISHGEITVPKDHYFVLGDNRDNSEDSRYWGFVARNEIVGQPLAVYFTTNIHGDPTPTTVQGRLRDIIGQLRIVE